MQGQRLFYTGHSFHKALITGEVDVLTMAPIFMPDEGIGKFATLALAGNPKIRITVQEDWLWRDIYEQIGDLGSVPRTWDYDTITGAELRNVHAPVFQSPVGLPAPEILAKAGKLEWGNETVTVLQEVAWEAVTQHPQSGVRETEAGSRGD